MLWFRLAFLEVFFRPLFGHGRASASGWPRDPLPFPPPRAPLALPGPRSNGQRRRCEWLLQFVSECCLSFPFALPGPRVRDSLARVFDGPVRRRAVLPLCCCSLCLSIRHGWWIALRLCASLFLDVFILHIVTGVRVGVCASQVSSRTSNRIPCTLCFPNCLMGWE